VTRAAGIILAGGKGRRLGGVRKADLRIGGAPLLDRVASRLAPHVESILLATGNVEKSSSLRSGMKTVPDDSSGPLAGIRAAAEYLARESAGFDIIVTVAVDTPFLPNDFAETLIEQARLHGAAYAAWGENFYPTNAAICASLLSGGLRQIGEGSGPRALLATMDAKRIDWRDRAASDPFASVNTLAELLAHQRRALLEKKNDIVIHRLEQ
jgi:molybdopterin-guanine dinucleotide biosynthesis protein A